MENFSPLYMVLVTVMMLFSFSVVYGFVLKLGSILVAIFAFPTYLGMYSLEHVRNLKSNDSFFVLSLPQENPWKLRMNLLASFVTFSIMAILEKLWRIESSSLNDSDKQVEVFKLLFRTDIFPPILIFGFFICLLSIYLISYHISEKDENDAWTKIENLSIPSLWKAVVKGSV